MSDRSDERKSLRRRTVRRVADAASRVVGSARLRAEELSQRGLPAPANTADVLLMESQKVAYAELHRRFTERAARGEGGLPSALEALDAMWENIRQLRAGAPAILHTLSNPEEIVRSHRSRFYTESTALLEDAIRIVFAEDMGQLAIPPDRMAVLVRVALEGLVVELAQARTTEDVQTVDQAYADLRSLFFRFVLYGDHGDVVEAIDLEPIALPW